MKRTLIVATTSYAGMGPYVSEIVNTFFPEDDVWYFFADNEDDFFHKNVKVELRPKSVFYRRANSNWNKLVDLVTNRSPYEERLLRLCKEKSIELVHYINGIPSIRMQHKYEDMGITVLSTVHDLEPHEAKKAWHKMLRQRIIYKRLNDNLQGAQYLVTNSMAQYENLKSRFSDKELTFHSFPSLVTKAITNGHDMPPEMKLVTKPYILFFGRIEEYKGISLLYEAFCKTPRLCEEYNLVIAGYGDLMIERRQDEKNVIVINRYIKDSEVAYLYSHAACVAYPYISATQSGVLSLAFYFGVPVVASDVPFFKGIIEPTGTGLLFRKGDVNDLAAKTMQALAADTTGMRRKQKEYYDHNYQGEAIHRSLMKIYAMEWTEKDLGGDCPKTP